MSYFKYFFALLLFGTNGIVASYILLTSYEIVFLRTLIGSLLLVTIFIFSREKVTCLNNKRDLVYITISGIAMGASWMFLYEAYQQIGVSIASLLYYCGPVIVMVLSPILFKEKLTKVKIAGFFVVLCGLFLVNIKALYEGKTGWGLLCGGMSAVMYAIMVIFNKKSKNIRGLENSTLQLLTSFLTVAVFIILKQGVSLQVEKSDWIPILILGLINTGLGCYFYFSSIGHLPVQTVAICGYLEPLSAVIFSALFLNEAMKVIQILGAVLILCGAVLGESLFSKTKKTKL
ncbi:MAG: DMT family transporter [Sedimentibacter sp.]